MKQLKSTSQDLRDLFEHSITVKHVAEKLKSCKAHDDAAVIKKCMEKLDFDVMGIEDEGAVYGYVEQSKLETGQYMKYQRIFHPSELIAESTPLIDILPILRDKPRVFVLDRNKVTGIITRGDLQKAPVRLLLFGLVTLLEMHLLHLVRIYYPSDSWQGFLKDTRLEKAKGLLARRSERNEAIDLADCLQFCDKRDLILRNQQIRERIGLKSKEDEEAGEHLLQSAEELRDKLAHAQDIVTGTTWPEIIDLAEEIEVLLKRCEEIEINKQSSNMAYSLSKTL